MIAYIRKTDALHLPWYVHYVFDCGCVICTEPMETYGQAHAHATNMGAKIVDATKYQRWHWHHDDATGMFIKRETAASADDRIVIGFYPDCQPNEQAGERARKAVVNPQPDHPGVPMTDDYLSDVCSPLFWLD